MNFVHLHNHSHYSLLQSPSSPKDIVKTAKEQGCTSVALTDNGVMYGAIEFYKACKEEDIKPIIGMEAYIAPRLMKDKDFRSDGKPWTLVLIAENNEGYENLLKLSSIAHLEGMYYKPRIDLEVLEKHKKGLIALSGGLNGEIPNAILEGFEEDDIKKIVKKYLNIFGKNNFFFEISYHPNISGQMEVNEKLIELSKDLNVSLVIGQNTYYTKIDEAEAQDILMCIGSNRLYDDGSRITMIDEDYSLTPPDEICSVFEETPDAIKNTIRIAERCNVKFDLGKYHIPTFNPPKGHSTKISSDYLRYECIEGLKNRYPQFKEYLEEIKWEKLDKSTIGENIQFEQNKENLGIELNNDVEKIFTGREIAQRFEHEFEIIKNMGFESYFLIVWDYIKWAKENNILVGPGRGSGAGSIIAYALKITNLEPLKYSLLFERFLNPDRISMPDFDIDFQDDKRNDVIDYVTQKYGTDHVAQISTFGTMAARAAVKDVGRAFGISFEKMNEFVKLIPERPGTKLQESWESEDDLRNTVNNDPELKKIWDIALKLEGCIRHISVHACAVVISEKPLLSYTAIQNPPKDQNSIITQFSAKPLESLGLLKMDFLGLKNLTILDTACKIIKRTTGRSIDLDEIPMKDEKTFEIFQNGETTGIFQFESSGMKRYLKDLKPTEFEDLIAMNSLYRPGPMEFIPEFINRKHGTIAVKYHHESLEKILKPTYGIAVYQEQILQIAQEFSGYSLGQADILRRAIGKKIISEMEEQRKTFIDKAIELGRNKDTAEYIFDKVVVPFAGYGFNKSHSAAYSMIAYQTAYLKAHYPTEFMAALLASDQSNTDRIAIEIEECQKMNIDILPPSVNESLKDFTVVKNRQIRFGLSVIKNLGDSCAEAIIESRGKEQIKFQNLQDFLTKIEPTQLNRKNLEALIKSGALDELEERNKMLENMESMIEFSQEQHQKSTTGQMGLFDISGETSSTDLHLSNVSSATSAQKLAWEKEFLGLFVSAHPLGGLEEYWKNNFFSVDSINAKLLGETKRFAGIITNLRIIKTKNEERMATFVLDAPTGKIDAVLFPKTFQSHGKKLLEDNLVVVKSKIDHRNGELQLIIESITLKDLDKIREEAKEKGFFDKDKNHLTRKEIKSISKEDIKDARMNPWIVEVPEEVKKNDFEVIKKLLEQNPGNNEIIFLFPNRQKITLPQKVSLTKTLKAHITQILYGPDKGKI